MTALASQTHMTARQREVAQIMIKSGIFPIGWLMAGGTIRAIFAAVFIILLMTGVTICGRADINTVLMTRLTLRFRMFAFQFEHGKVMVELCRSPSIGGMTVGAIQTIPTFMRLVLAMTGKTILRSILKIGERPRIEMALDADHFDMFAIQPKRKIMLKIFPEPVHAIVTIETSIAIRDGMCQGEGRIDLTVTGLTGVGSEGGYIAMMTIIAGKRFIRSRTLVSV